jgi:hypothetical protein
MPHPQSLLAELRALEAKRAQGGLSPTEEARLAELQAVTGAAPAPRGFDVNAAAAAIRDALQPARSGRAAAAPPVPLPLPQPDAGALGPRTPPLEAELVPPEALPPAPEEDLAPLPGIEAGAPEGYDLAAPPPVAPQDVALTQEYDVVPAFDASSAPAQWDPGAVPGEAAWAPGTEEAWQPAAPQKPHDTASWDLSGSAGPAMVVPDEGDPGATAVWNVGQAADAAPLSGQLPEGWAEGVEPAFLDELQLESEGSFALPGAGAEAAQPPADTWPGEGSAGEPVPGSPGEVLAGEPEAPAGPPGADLFAGVPVGLPGADPFAEAPAGSPGADLFAAPPAEAAVDAGAPLAAEPLEVSDDQILEVGEEVVAVPDDIPTLEGVELVEEPPAAAPEPEPVPAPPAAEPPPPPAAAVPEAVEPPPAPPAVLAPPTPPAVLAPATRPAVQSWAGGEPAAPEGEPVPLESLTIDEAPLEVAAPPAVPAPPPPAQRVVAGLHRVVVHTVEGQVKRGSLSDPDLEASELVLFPQPSGPTEALPAERVRAIFFMLGSGEKPPAPEGQKVRVTFKDGRQVAGFSPDYDPAANGFFMIPADTRTNTARIWVYRSAVRQVSVS